MTDRVRTPAEWEPHDACLMAWPTTTRRDTLWRGRLDAARVAWAEVIRAVAAFEPVLLAVEPDMGFSANRIIGRTEHPVEVFEVPIDDCWTRDSGPILVHDQDGKRQAVGFRFNAWGEKYTPYADDAELARRVCEHLGLLWTKAPIVLEGGSIAVDGAGTLVTTERCLLHPNRNGGDQALIEETLRTGLGIDHIVWLADGLHDDDETDGHVDNVVAFFEAGKVMLQGCDDADDPDHAGAAANRTRLEAVGIEVIELAVLPRVECLGEVVEVPYANYYVANGGVVVPVTGHWYDAEALRLIAGCYPDREVVGVPGEVLGYGGGGVHCITQQIPAAAVAERKAT